MCGNVGSTCSLQKMYSGTYICGVGNISVQGTLVNDVKDMFASISGHPVDCIKFI